MFKKLLLLSLTTTTLVCTVSFASVAKLHIINQTDVTSGWPSVAKIKVIDKVYGVCPKGSPICGTEIMINVPANEIIRFNLEDFIFGNGHLNPNNMDQSCHDVNFTIKDGETKTIYIEGKPSNEINWDSRIICSV